MKTMKLMLCAVTVIAAASCAKEIAPENNQGNNTTPELNLIPMTFTAGAEKTGQPDSEPASDQVESRVLLQSDGKNLHWESTDRIKVFDDTETDLPAFTTTGSGASVDFTGGVSAETGTYYALYPYQADAKYGASTIASQNYGNVITATVPTEQIAVPNGIHSDAFIAAAKSDNGNGYFKFKTICGFIKFQLSEEDAANAVAVSISGNNLAGIAGNVEIYFTTDDGTTSAFGQDYVRGETKDYVTLTGSFQADTDYYFAIRSNKFESGFTMTIRYADGSSKYVTTTQPAPQNVSRNMIMNIGKPVFKPGLPNDLYIAWQHGLDVDIAGEAFNKATYGAATLFTSDQTVNADGVYFVTPGTTSKINYNAVGNKLIVVGRYADQKSTMNLAKILQPNTTAENSAIAFKNLNITFANTNQPFQVRSNFGCIAIDNSVINSISHSLITGDVTVNGTAYKNRVNIVAITNSDIQIKGENKDAAYIYLSSSTEKHSTIRFNNNVVYFVEGTKVTKMKDFKLCQINNGDLANITVENNIFDKTTIPNAGFVNIKNFTGNIIVKNNLFNEVTEAYKIEGEVTTLQNSTLVSAGTPVGGEITANFYYRADPNNTRTFSVKSSATTTTNLSKANTPQLAKEAILTDWDPANGKYGIAENITYYNTGSQKDVTISTADIGAKR